MLISIPGAVAYLKCLSRNIFASPLTKTAEYDVKNRRKETKVENFCYCYFSSFSTIIIRTFDNRQNTCLQRPTRVYLRRLLDIFPKNNAFLSIAWWKFLLENTYLNHCKVCWCPQPQGLRPGVLVSTCSPLSYTTTDQRAEKRAKLSTYQYFYKVRLEWV